MSMRLKHDIERLASLVRHGLSAEQEQELMGFRRRLGQFSEDTVRAIRKEIERLWDEHDEDVESAREFFERCRNLYRGLVASEPI